MTGDSSGQSAHSLGQHIEDCIQACLACAHLCNTCGSDMIGMQQSLIERAADVYWAGAARMTIKADPDVLN